MDNEKTNKTQPETSQHLEPEQPEALHPYHAPTMVRYGGLAELVQRRPNRGVDGESMFADCTFS